MKWHLRDRKGKAIAAGTLEQVLVHLKYRLPDGEYELVGAELTIRTRRYRGVLYPFDQWEGWEPAEVVKRYRRGG